MYEKFNIDYVSEPILKEIGCGTDNLVQYSDGNSFKELLGESVFGCGDLISLISIPEVFVEMYNKNEYQETKKYRREIERPSSLPDWLGDLLNERVHDQAHINDLVQDLTIGIPDQDYILGKTITYDNWLRWEDWEISYPDDEWSEKDERKLISRWKSMIRPLFLKTMTSNYRMPAYDDSTTLGNTDYRNFSIRGTSNVPLSPTIYDRIDNAVSLKVDDNTVNNDNSIQSGFNVWNFILDRIVQTYSSTLQIPGTDIDIFIPNIAAIQKTYELIETLIIDPSKIDWKNVSKDVLIESIKMVIIYILGKIITDLETVNPSRYSLKPLRVFKSGGVILESRSGLYTTPHEPCPIIFLGFNDGMQINEKIENLSKTDEIHSLYYTDPKTKSKISIGENLDLVNRGLIVRTNQGVLQNTFILPGSLTNISVGSADVEPEIKDPFLEMGIYSRPIMNRRIKKYGINPLLDVFYLNMKPAEKSKHPYARKVPFGWDKEQLFVDEQPQSYIPDNIWPEFTWGQYPSIFPPLWNDFVRSTDLPDLEDFNLKPGAVWGDRAWSRRTPNTILEIEKRWETYLLPLPENEFSNMEKSPEQIEYNSINPNNDIVVFKDKTPILDLYFMLMEMHVRGFSWAEILNYVKQIKGCVTKVQARKGKSNWFMDLDRLEEIFLTVSTTLSMTLISDDLPSEATAFNGVFTTPMIIWGMKKDLSESDISGTQLPSSDYMQYMTVLNRTDKNLLIESIKIETIPGNSNDIIGNSGKDFFFLKEIPNGFIGSPDKSSFLNINKEVLGPISIPPVRSDQNNNKIYDFRDMFTMPVYFLPDMAVHSHEYTARIVLKGNIGGEEYDESIIISGTPMKKLDIGTSKELEEDPFFIPNDIYFPNLAKESNFISGINYYSTRKPRNQQTGKRAKTYTIEYIKLSNMSDYFDIIIEEMEFKTQYAYGKFEYRAATLTSGAPYVIEPFDKPPYYNQPPYNTEVPFFKFIEYDENGREKLLEQKKILLNKRLSASTFDTLDELIKQGKTIMYEQHVAFTPIYEDKIYVTNIDVTYSIVMNVSGLGDIFDSNNRFKKSIKLVGNFINPN